MIGSLAFQGLPEELKSVVFSRIKALMTMPRPQLPSKFTYFGEAERKEIHESLNARFPGYAGTK
jgi:hypothetical protein